MELLPYMVWFYQDTDFYEYTCSHNTVIYSQYVIRGFFPTYAIRQQNNNCEFSRLCQLNASDGDGATSCFDQCSHLWARREVQWILACDYSCQWFNIAASCSYIFKHIQLIIVCLLSGILWVSYGYPSRTPHCTIVTPRGQTELNVINVSFFMVWTWLVFSNLITQNIELVACPISHGDLYNSDFLDSVEEK